MEGRRGERDVVNIVGAGEGVFCGLIETGALELFGCYDFLRVA